jgi:peptidoglycan/xylan/chitin deacetylase (PgdA/CDA1 family)
VRAILTYHSIDDSGSPISVSRSRFADDVQWLASGAVTVLSVPDLLALDADRAAVAITFDDGFSNFATTAWPLLRDRNLSATLFVPTRYVGSTNRWAHTPGGGMPTLPLLSWDGLGRLAEEGVVLGAHTRTHADLRVLSDDEIREEIAGSIEDIARETGRMADSLAYPYGYFNDRVVTATRRFCKWACTTVLRSISPRDDRYLLPRFDSYFLTGLGRLESFGSPVFRSYMSIRSTIRRLRGR